MQLFTGALYDALGNYDAGFYFAGTMIFISGAMLFAIPALQKRLETKKPTFDITSGKGQDEFVPEVWKDSKRPHSDVHLVHIHIRW